MAQQGMVGLRIERDRAGSNQPSLPLQKYLSLERVGGYIKAREKSTSVVLSWKEVFDPWPWNGDLKVHQNVNVVSPLRSGEPDPT